MDVFPPPAIFILQVQDRCCRLIIGNGGNPEELEKLASAADPKFVIMTPGVNLAQSGDGLKQSYNTPEKAIAAGSDAIIVGRGIYKADNPLQAAKDYRTAAWRAYLAR